MFDERMTELADPNRSDIIHIDRNLEKEKNLLDTWRERVASVMNDWYDRARCLQESEETEAILLQVKEEQSRLQAELDDAQKNVDFLQIESSELSNLLTEAIRLRDDANRIHDKQVRIKQLKDMLYIPSSNGRDLKQVEADQTSLLEEKERLMLDVSKLNKEMSSLNSRISMAASNASNSERAAREKEEQYKQSQDVADRKISLSEKLTALAEQEKKVCVFSSRFTVGSQKGCNFYALILLDFVLFIRLSYQLQEQIAPTRQQILAKEGDRIRTRSSHQDEEKKAEGSLQSFRQDFFQLTTICETVNRYMRTNKAYQLEQMNMELSEIEVLAKEKKVMLSAMEPEIEESKARHNQKERQKRIIDNNISLLESMEQVAALEAEVNELTEELETVRRNSQASENYASATKRKEQLKMKKTMCEGRLGGLREQLKNLKRKLQAEEYKDVDERHRVKMIQHETTLLAVSDLDKYYTGEPVITLLLLLN